jgi:FkbM family methyltransferase
MKLKRKIREIINGCGLDITRFSPDSSLRSQYLQQLLHHQINIIFDIGANTGQYGLDLRSLGYKGKIISFEPLPECHKKLKQTANADKTWIVAPRAAVGDRIGEGDINVSLNSVSSSLLRMLPLHENSAPTSKVVRKESTPLVTIDSIANTYLLSPDDNLFIKIDTQGYEDRVIGGMENIFNRVKGLQIELSLLELYQDQLLFKDIVELLTGKGFQIWGMAPAFVDSTTGQTLQFDATFFRAEK